MDAKDEVTSGSSHSSFGHDVTLETREIEADATSSPSEKGKHSVEPVSEQVRTEPAASSGPKPVEDLAAENVEESETEIAEAVDNRGSIPQQQENGEAEAVADVERRLAEYRRRESDLKQRGQAKPDMVTCKELKQNNRIPAPRHGHVPGVNPGMEFNGRGEMTALGLHLAMMRGIDSRANEPAYAIVLSGGYKDDTDEGVNLTYTGEGGQKNGKQVQDQQWTNGNKALQLSCERQTPVRVFRGKLTDERNAITGKLEKKRGYVYEGLYTVVKAYQAPSQDGPLVCKFDLTAVPGESQASTTVKGNIFGSSKGFRVHRLAAATDALPEGRKRRTSTATPRANAAPTKRQKRAQTEPRLPKRGRSPRLHVVMEDISNGQEPLKIPVVNEVNDEKPPELEYINDYAFRDYNAVAADLEQASDAVRELCPTQCGLHFNRNMPNTTNTDPTSDFYNSEGALLMTDPFGVHECSSSCTGEDCNLNQVVTKGIKLPLEVFMTKDKGWGLRCREPIAIGTFVCAYIGEIIDDQQANALHGKDGYLFDLDHFVKIHEELSQQGTLPQEHEELKRLPPLRADRSCNHLVIDAAHKCNVARFINHSCDPNLTKQPVLAKSCRSSLLYYVALFAEKHIEADTELTYDYEYEAHSIPGRKMECRCGSANCRGTLL